MRCYRIDEDVFQGIPLTGCNGGRGYYIDVGDEQVRVDESLSNRVYDTREKVLETLRVAMRTGMYDGVRLSGEERNRVGNTLATLVGESIQLIYADVGPDNEITSEPKRHHDALVLVETVAGVNGRIHFKSSTYDEYLDMRSNRVKRRYQQVFPPPGVTVIKEGKTRQGSKVYLLRMAPSSSFRIERTGMLDGEPSILTVVWKGRKSPNGALPLLMFSPDRRQE